MTKWKRGACSASQPCAEGGPRSSSVALRCRDSPGGATHLRIRVARPEDGLLRVGAEAARDHEPDAVAAGGAREPVEGARDVGAHRHALAVRERAVVAAAGGEGRRRAADGRRELGLGVRREVDRPAREREVAGDGHAHPDRRDRLLVGEGHAGRRRRAAVAPRDLQRGCRPSSRYAAFSRWRGFARPARTAGSKSRG